MKRLLGIFLWAAVAVSSVFAQPEFGPVRMDGETDERFFYPTIEVTESNTFYSTWASANLDWIGAYGREVNMQGEIVSDIDTLDIASTVFVSCPPRVEQQRRADGAYCHMIYHE